MGEKNDHPQSCQSHTPSSLSCCVVVLLLFSNIACNGRVELFPVREVVTHFNSFTVGQGIQNNYDPGENSLFFSEEIFKCLIHLEKPYNFFFYNQVFRKYLSKVYQQNMRLQKLRPNLNYCTLKFSFKKKKQLLPFP